MGDLISMNMGEENEVSDGSSELIDATEALLTDARTVQQGNRKLSVPIAELSTLGAGVSSLIPAFNTVTQTTSVAANDLYTIANMGVQDTLKMAKNGNFWGAFKTPEGASKFVQLQAADPVSISSKSVAAINPATMLMAVALFSIEKEIGKIEDMQKQILSFLEVEKEAEIEADVEILMNVVSNYKLNWDNEHFVAGNHKLVLDIQRTARKNMNAYQKKVTEIIEKKQLIVAQMNVKQSVNNLEKQFKYYRLSLYTFALAAFMEIMLSGNFKEEYISGVKDEIGRLTEAYCALYDKCLLYLEKMGKSTVETNVLKGVGAAGKAVGKFIGSIPLIKEGQVDEFLQDSGSQLKQNAIGMEKEMIQRFDSVKEPNTNIFIDKLEDMIQIYNHTEQICFDDKQIYLVTSA